MNERILRVGIIGCGKIASTHAEAVAATAGAALVACCDAELARAQSLAADFGAELAVDSLDEFFAKGQLDAAFICTPHPVHEQLVVACAEAGVNVLCEKPIAIRLEEADRMIAATDNAGVAFGVIFQRRFWPAAQRIRRAIDEGAWGTLTFASASSRSLTVISSDAIATSSTVFCRSGTSLSNSGSDHQVAGWPSKVILSGPTTTRTKRRVPDSHGYLAFG